MTEKPYNDADTAYALVNDVETLIERIGDGAPIEARAQLATARATAAVANEIYELRLLLAERLAAPPA